MKKIIKKIVNMFGYYYFKKSVMPYGLDYLQDIKRYADGISEISCIFDIGANIGQSSLEFQRVFPDSTIYSFEPVKKTFSELLQNTRAYSNIHCFNIAMGHVKEQAVISLYSNSEWNSLVKSDEKQQNIIGHENTDIETLDSFCESKKISKVDMIKIDTEGFDLQVLHGGINMLQKSHNLFVYVECAFNRKNRTHSNFRTIEDELSKHNFEFVGLYDMDYVHNPTRRPPLLYCNALFFKK